MRIPTEAQREVLAAQAGLYHSQVTGAVEYLNSRGLGDAAIEQFKLGFTGETGDRFRNRLSIPYLSPAGVWHIKYRCIEQHDCKAAGHRKYDSEAGIDLHLYNASVLATATVVAFVEGEIDTASGEMCGWPHVGYPGINAWMSNIPGSDRRRGDAWRWCFDSVDEVVVVGDGDEVQAGKTVGVGEESALTVAASLRDAHPDILVRSVILPVGYDPNKFIHDFGQFEYLEKVGLI
jgi:hypothetical protein